MRIFTFTPADFHPFPYSRDSGLTARGLQALGVESKVVLFGARRSDDDPDTIRITWDQACSADWWRQWQLDAVVSYSWAQPRHAPLLRAMRAADLRIFLRLDCGEALLTPRIEPGAYLRRTFNGYRDLGHTALVAALAALAKTAVNLSPSYYLKPLMDYFALADALGVESPLGAERLVQAIGIAGRRELIERVHTIGHPVADYMRYAGEPKAKQIIAVGRWESFVKNAPLLLASLGQVLTQRPDYTAVICGSGAERLHLLARRLAPEVQGRIQILGPVANEALPAHHGRSQLMVVSSRWESFNIAAAEALCCGCSIVGPHRIGSMRWFAADDCGTTAATYDLPGLTAALLREIKAWEEGRRKPERISALWRERVAAPSVARQIVQVLQLGGI